MMAAVFVVMERNFVCGISHILQAVIHLGYIRIRVTAGRSCVKINERCIIAEIFFAEIVSTRLVIISPKRRGERACCTEYLGILHCNIECLKTTEGRSCYRRSYLRRC